MPGALEKEAAQTSWAGDGRKALVQHHVFSKMTVALKPGRTAMLSPMPAAAGSHSAS